MAFGVVTRTALTCYTCAVLFSFCMPAVAGARPWVVEVLEAKTTTPRSPNITTETPSTTTPMPPTAESMLWSHSGSTSKKHQLHTSMNPQSAPKNNTVNKITTSEAPLPSIALAAVQMEPQLFPSIQPQLLGALKPEMLPL
ncbi:uncharacterized protein LOC126267976 [Schistocerca gregaria]|uniref:uncharacterized protein LOC126267976 n=1 Tax=Schistocerca gregaria TaxID=7010 RepID=UPI00211E143A|nr:uncharacterized protein LOC126267976 [Schistocerca gregaria]